MLLVGAREVLPILLKANYEVVLADTAERALSLLTTRYDAAIVEGTLERGLIVANYLAAEGVCPLVLHPEAKRSLIRHHLVVLCVPDGKIDEAELLAKLETAVGVTREVCTAAGLDPLPQRARASASNAATTARPRRAAQRDIHYEDGATNEITEELDMTELLGRR